MPLDRPVAAILREPGRHWKSEPPADEDEIAELRERVPFALPPEYLELLRYGDGGEGELDAPPLWLQMHSISSSVELNEMWRKRGEFLNFWFIGSNGGLESIAFDLRAGPPWPLVMIDCIAGDASAQRIADDMADFIRRIGVAAERSCE